MCTYACVVVSVRVRMYVVTYQKSVLTRPPGGLKGVSRSGPPRENFE